MLAIRNVTLTVLFFIGNFFWKIYLFFKDKEVPTDVKKILIITTAGIGNNLLLIPALKNLRKIFPKSYISVLVANSTTADILRNIDEVNNIIIYDVSRIAKAPRFMKQNYSFIRNLHREGFDLVIIPYPLQDITTAMVAFLSGSRFRLGYSYPAGYLHNCCFLYTNCLVAGKQKHEVGMNLDLIKLFGMSDFDQEFELPISVEEKQFAHRFFLREKLYKNDFAIGIHPGSGFTQKYKRWPLEHFAELINQISSRNCKIILFGGKEEIELFKDITKLTNVEVVNAIGKLTIMQTAAVIKKCTLFISNDSGLMHLAASVKTPTVAIFGPTNHIKNKPLGGGHVIIRKGLLCSPCHKQGLTDRNFKCKNRKCFQLISVEDVLKAIDVQLDKIENRRQVLKKTKCSEKL